MIQTDDLFLGAFVLVRGGELKAVDVRGLNGRRVAVFQIEGLDESRAGVSPGSGDGGPSAFENGGETPQGPSLRCHP